MGEYKTPVVAVMNQMIQPEVQFQDSSGYLKWFYL